MPTTLDSPLNYACHENLNKNEIKNLKHSKYTDQQQYFIGVEGGASKTTICLVTSTGEILYKAVGESSNPFTVGAAKCFLILKSLISEVITKNPEKQISCAGFSLSGGTSEETKNIKNKLELEFPMIGECYFTIDTYGAIATTCKAGGIVLIAGTGSNALIVNGKGEKVGNCGGWGHLFGDEGSAFDIARRAMQIVIRAEDGFFSILEQKVENFNDSGFTDDKLDLENVKNAMMDYFEAEEFEDLIPHMYPPKFDKTFFACFTKELVKLANNGDDFSRFLFFECGQNLANHVLAFDKHFPELFKGKTIRIPVVCEGSVWLSWNLIRPGFLNELRKKYSGLNHLEYNFRLVRPKVSCAVGAARLAAENFGFDIDLNFDENVELLDDILWMEIK